MGFRENSFNQIALRDRANNLTQREKQYFEKSWAKPFFEYVFSNINESIFEVLYCAENGRPNTPVNVVVGALLLKEQYGLTDEEMVQVLLFDVRFQYALGLTSYEEIPFSDRTLSRFRERLYSYEQATGKDILREAIDGLSESYIKLMKIDTKIKRVDSMMVSSSCKKMTRLELFYRCVANMVYAVDGAGRKEILAERYMAYLEEGHENLICYRLKDEEIAERLETALKDALELEMLCRAEFGNTAEYRQLKRLLDEQTRVSDTGIVLNKSSEISADCMQNPSDEDATFRKKAGKGYRGYSANIVEVVSENGCIIIDYDVQKNTYDDQRFGQDVIDRNTQRGDTVIADGAYESSENRKAAAEIGAEFVTSNLSGTAPDEALADFKLDEEGRAVVECPKGHQPISSTYYEKSGSRSFIRTKFELEHCKSCPMFDICKPKIQKNATVVTLGNKTVERAKYVRALTTEKYKKASNIRNGVEGMPSVLRRKYGVDHIPVRGLMHTKMWFAFKIAAINSKRLTAWAMS